MIMMTKLFFNKIYKGKQKFRSPPVCFLCIYREKFGGVKSNFFFGWEMSFIILLLYYVEIFFRYCALLWYTYGFVNINQVASLIAQYLLDLTLQRVFR